MTRLAFVLEEIMGHVTHTQNLAQAARADPSVQSTFFSVPGDCRLSQMRLLRNNYLMRVSLAAYLNLRHRTGEFRGVLFHTQATSLLSTGLMRRLPAVISTDATPAQYNALGAYGSAAPPAGRAAAVKNRIYTRTFARTRHMIALSEWCAASMTADYGVPREKISVIPPGVDVSVYRPEPAARPQDGVVRVLFVGASYERKGGDLLLRWARETRVSVPWELHLVTHKLLEETPHVVLHSSVQNNSAEMVGLYQQSDLFVLPTRADCTPIVTMEAMSSGLPVITTRVGGLGEQLRDGETGLLIEPNDYEALAEALDALILDASLRAAMSRAAREKALVDFNTAINFRNVVETVKGVAA